MDQADPEPVAEIKRQILSCISERDRKIAEAKSHKEASSIYHRYDKKLRELRSKLDE